MSHASSQRQRAIGCCYYPEHWPQSMWQRDAERMVETGISWVRIGEFAWQHIEPVHDSFDWDWLDTVMDILGEAGLNIVLGTPTATPPRWMLERQPDMLATDEHGRPRRFGSRRHYCFSHTGYREECVRIAETLANRYANHPALKAWQIDNEYGCHATTHSYSQSALASFRDWLIQRYGDIDNLNRAWGNTFWSMAYDHFDQIDLPNLTVTEVNPAHQLAFKRFSSDQVVSFNRLQVDAIRQYSDAPISHNFMGRVTDFDHFEIGNDLDIATWDSYPIGFLAERIDAGSNAQQKFARQGEPDFQAMHHDLYRAVGCDRWWVMEQQPGPVNWAPYNPAPLPGMVRLWGWEAFAHGAEVVSYFRWRQAPFAQEQLHAGLERPDGEDAPGKAEVRQLAAELKQSPCVVSSKADVAIVFDYEADYFWSIQPHAPGCDYFGLVFDFYRGLRAHGVSVDFLPASTTDFRDYRLLLAPGLVHMSDSLKSALAASNVQLLLGPNCGARDNEMTIPIPLPPDFPGLDIQVCRVEGLGPNMSVTLNEGGILQHYREHLDGAAEVVERCADNEPAVVQSGIVTYLAGWPDKSALSRILERALQDAGVDTLTLPDGLRRRKQGQETYWINYNDRSIEFAGLTIPATSMVRQHVDLEVAC